MKTQMFLISMALVAGCAQPETQSDQNGLARLSPCKADGPAILKLSSGLETDEFVQATLFTFANSKCSPDEFVQNLDQRLSLFCDGHCYLQEKK
ncbi:MAG: hypothetical protein H7326_06615 [Bdellovibrionaceae bacterium]|nr:hypothetical protein [Pseudobdellovibrionaceae bacterium]